MFFYKHRNKQDEEKKIRDCIICKPIAKTWWRALKLWRRCLGCIIFLLICSKIEGPHIEATHVIQASLHDVSLLMSPARWSRSDKSTDGVRERGFISNSEGRSTWDQCHGILCQTDDAYQVLLCKKKSHLRAKPWYYGEIIGHYKKKLILATT